jgi:four helix bundle protein
MQNPTKLRVFAEAEELAVLVYQIARKLPREELYGLGQQMRRAAVSVGSNIAEGCGRSGNRELVRFASIALGSATELEFQLRLSLRLGYVDVVACDSVVAQARSVQRMLTNLIKKLRPASEASRGRP